MWRGSRCDDHTAQFSCQADRHALVCFRAQSSIEIDLHISVRPSPSDPTKKNTAKRGPDGGGKRRNRPSKRQRLLRADPKPGAVDANEEEMMNATAGGVGGVGDVEEEEEVEEIEER